MTFKELQSIVEETSLMIKVQTANINSYIQKSESEMSEFRNQMSKSRESQVKMENALAHLLEIVAQHEQRLENLENNG